MFKKGFILFVIFSLVLAWTGPLTQQLYAEQGYIERPPLNGWRIAGELAAGAGGTFCGVFLSFLVMPGIPTLALFPVLGSSLAVCGVGNIGEQTASSLATLVGSFLGELAGAGIWLATNNVEAYGHPIFLVTIPVGATIGFNLTRRYKSYSHSALINFRDGELSLGIPQIYLRPSLADNRNLIQTVDLVKARF